MQKHNDESGSRDTTNQGDQPGAPLNEANDRGAGLAEYGMLLFFILFASLVIMTTFGQTLANQFAQINAALAGLN